MSFNPFEAFRVKDIMAHPVETLSSESPVEEIVEFFIAPHAPRRHKSYPVIDRDGRLVGMVSRTDAFRWMTDDELRGKSLAKQLAGQGLVIGYDDELAGELADRMADTERSRVPILRRSDGRLVGLVARRDLLRVRADSIEHERERERLIRLGGAREESTAE